ncbi:MAG: TolC family protein [Pirellulaceae bacterium]
MRLMLQQLALCAMLVSSFSGCSLMPPPDPAQSVGGIALAAQQQDVTLDESQIPSYQDVRSSITPLLSDVSQPLTAAECACRAAAESRTAAALDREAAHLRREACAYHRRGVSHLLPGFMSDQARQQRNDAAEQALIAYYRLTDVQLQQELLAESYQELQRTQDALEGLLAAGLPATIDQSELERQRYQLDQQGLQLTYDRARATAQVKSLIGDDPLSPESIETTCAIQPRPTEFGLAEALEIGRANDVQLRALCRFLQAGDLKDLDVARALLKTVSPLMGQAPASLSLHAKLKLVLALGHNHRGDQELALRRKQLQSLYLARRQQVDLEVANEVLNAQQRYYDLGIAKDVLDSWDERVTLLESNRELQKSEYTQVVTARAERLKARSDLWHKLIELEIAHVQLEAVLGLLGEECIDTGLH